MFIDIIPFFVDNGSLGQKNMHVCFSYYIKCTLGSSDRNNLLSFDLCPVVSNCNIRTTILVRFNWSMCILYVFFSRQKTKCISFLHNHDQNDNSDIVIMFDVKIT